VQWAERADADRVEDPRSRPAEVHLAGGDRANHVDLRVAALASGVLVVPLDAQSAAGDPPDRLVERLQLAEVVVRVGHDEDLRLDGLVAAGAVRVLRATAGQQGHGQEGDEGLGSHGSDRMSARRRRPRGSPWISHPDPRVNPVLHEGPPGAADGRTAIALVASA
jgi:hypothetical protein